MELQREELEKLYAETFHRLEEGKILRGRVLQVKQVGVIVDIGYKCEGFVPAEEFSEEELSKIKPADEIEVYIVDINDSEGIVIISKDKASKIKTWDVLENAYEKGAPIDGKIIGKVKGGLTVDVSGVKAFLPGSQVDLKILRDVDQLIGQTLPFKVIKVNHKKSNVIVSRRVLLEEERKKMREKTLSRLKEGAIMEGVIKNLTDYGAFIDLGGVDGLLHISDMSWGRISHPGELFSIGETVEVVVLKFDSETGKVTLGYKQKRPDPWETADEKYPPGKRITGRITSLPDYGIFVEIEDGLEGRIHVTEVDWTEKIKKPSKYFSIGDTVDAVVLKVDKAERKISLSIKQLKPSPWEEIGQKYKIGQQVTGRVRSFTDFGAFVGLEEGADALLHISDMSWTKHIKHPSELCRKGQKIDAVVLSIEPEKGRMALGLKQLTPDPWIEEIPNKFKPGDKINGKIIKITDFGLFMELEGGVEGLIYSSEIEKDGKTLHEKLEEHFKIGDEITAKIIRVDTAERKIGLSMKMHSV